MSPLCVELFVVRASHTSGVSASWSEATGELPDGGGTPKLFVVTTDGVRERIMHREGGGALLCFLSESRSSYKELGRLLAQPTARKDFV